MRRRATSAALTAEIGLMSGTIARCHDGHDTVGVDHALMHLELATLAQDADANNRVGRSVL